MEYILLTGNMEKMETTTFVDMTSSYTEKKYVTLARKNFHSIIQEQEILSPT